MSTPKPDTSILSSKDLFDEKQQAARKAALLEDKLLRRHVDICKFNAVKVAASALFEEKGDRAPTDDELLRLGRPLPPAESIEHSYDMLVSMGKIKPGKCPGGR